MIVPRMRWLARRGSSAWQMGVATDGAVATVRIVAKTRAFL